MSGRLATAVVVDDEPLAIEGLKRHCASSGAASVIGEATGGAAGLRLIERLKPDVAFLDISMPGMSGIRVAEALASSCVAPLIIFVTAHDHYATEAFDLAVVDYVLKPIVEKRMHRAIERVAAILERRELPAATKTPAEFWVPFRGRVVKLRADQIIRIEAERDYVRLCSSENSYLVRATMTEMLSRLDPNDFVRIHRSTAVPRNRITAFRHLGGGAWAVVDPEGTEASVGRSYLAAVRDAMKF
jgi:two-component system, LytTR family, response regulator AlgR